jgi:hypothetical protein
MREGTHGESNSCAWIAGMPTNLVNTILPQAKEYALNAMSRDPIGDISRRGIAGWAIPDRPRHLARGVGNKNNKHS